MGNEATQTDFLRIDPAKQEQASDLWSLKGDILLESQLSQWRFFEPPAPIVEQILELNERLVESHLEHEEQSLKDQEEPIDSDVAEEPSRLNQFFAEAADILFHDRGNDQRDNMVNSNQPITYFQSIIGERIYNHLAMLSRSPHAKEGGTFSIREELTEELAGKIGLGLYLRLNTDDELRKETNYVLLNLALEFQNWLLEERREVYFAPWGVVCTPNKGKALKDLNDRPRLLLSPDVETSLGTRGRASIQTG